MGKKVCSVPFCESQLGTGLSFHEIPANEKLKELWLKKNFQGGFLKPDQTLDSKTLVCSLHFSKNDYKTGKKLKRLKPDAIPSIFPGYPSYMNKPKITRKAPTTRSALAPVNKTIDLQRQVSTANFQEQNQIFKDDLDIRESIGMKRSRSLTPTYDENENPATLSTSAESVEEVCKNQEWKISCLTDKIKNLEKIIHSLRSSNYRKDNTILDLSRKLRIKQNNFHDKSLYPDSIKKLKFDAEKGNVKASILLQQIQAYGKKRFSWSELCIRMCVLWSSKSPKAYCFAKNKLVNLPSRSTLRKYVGPSHLETGITELAVERMKQEITSLTEHKTLCSLIFDEMSLQPRLQYSRQADKVIGFAQYGRSVNKKYPTLANRLLCFVIKGLSKNYRVPVAYFLVRQLQGQQLANLIDTVLTKVEEIGFRVCRLVCDDASINVKALSIFCDDNLTHEIMHPLRNDDPLFISFDPCHILKNLRNQFMDEKRSLENQGQTISGNAIRILYMQQEKLPAKPIRFLSRKVVNPTPFEKMNVKRAIQLFSTEVISALQLCSQNKMPGFENLSQTLEFMSNVQKWFSIHNVCNRSHYITSRDENKSHFWLVDDHRLNWLENDFLQYFMSWKLSSTGLRSKSFLTKETHQALEITTHSTVACIKYLLSSGLHFVLTRKLTSDDIEGIFSAVRSTQGYNDQANARGSIYALELILKTGIFSSSSYANHSHEHCDTLTIASKTCNVLNRKMPLATTFSLNTEQLKLVSRLSHPPIRRTCTTKNAGIAMICGFLLRLLKSKHSCQSAGAGLAGNASHGVNKLITLLDRGGLMYPSPSFVGLVEVIFDILKAGDPIYSNEALVKSWKQTLLSVLPDNCLKCDCGNVSHTNDLRNIVLKSICKIYFSNISFNETDSVNQKPNFCTKPVSKKIKKL